MATFNPDQWVVVEVKTPHHHGRKVLASWHGDYIAGDRWRMSSGITKVDDNNDHYVFHNESGSIYKCFKQSQGMSVYTAALFEDWKTNLPEGTTMAIDAY